MSISRSSWLCLVVRVFATFLFTLPASADYTYVVTTGSDLKELRVNLCFEGTSPDALIAESMDAPIALKSVKAESGAEIVPSGLIPTRDLGPNSCLDYSVDVSRGVQRHDMTGPKVSRFKNAIAISNGLWFWRPESIEEDRRIFVSFILPDNYAVSTSWSSLSDGPNFKFEVPRTPYDWPSWIVVGQFSYERVSILGTRFNITIIDGSPSVEVEEMVSWLSQEARMVQSSIGKLPFSEVEIILFPNARARQPVPIAYVTRGGGPALHLRINQRRLHHEFIKDWTATHELSHLFLPFVVPEDAWFYEGLASYYQNVIRSRGGLMSQADAWSNILYGFRRGSREAEVRQISLRDATERMYRGEPFMYVYWGGAAMMLLADVKLRRDSDGQWSLDRLVREFDSCCVDKTKEWTAKEILSKFDAFYGEPVFIPLMDKYLDTHNFPDVSRVVKELGLTIDGRTVTLLDDAPRREIRDAIMLGTGGSEL